jgi:hypothetical protein
VSKESEKRFSPKRESVVNRGQASALAASQPQRAFDLARTIPDGWYRCQAMATIGRHAPDPLSERAFGQARVAAAAGDDNYQRAGVLAFAITAALGRARRDLANAMLADALALICSVEPMGSRAYAVNLLWSTIAHNGDHAMREAVIAATKAHIHPDRSWRAKRLYRDIVANLAWDRPDRAEALIRAMPEGRARAFIERRRAEGERRRP